MSPSVTPVRLCRGRQGKDGMGVEDLLTIVECGDPVLRRPAAAIHPDDLATDEMRR